MESSTSYRLSNVGRQRQAFTLIEVLVVVAIIALLVSVLMPAMKSAKESAKATTCLSNLKQQGTGIAAYSKDNKQYMPYGGYGRYPLIDGGYHNLRFEVRTSPTGNSYYQPFFNVWCRQGNGVLFPRYTGNTVDLFYCASNTGAGPDNPQRGKKQFMKLYNNPHSPGSHNYPEAPIGGYAYSLPVAMGKSPRDGTKTVFPLDSLTEYRLHTDTQDSYSAWYYFMRDPVLHTNPDARSYLGPVIPPSSPANPSGGRGNYPTQAILVDAYFSGYSGYHVNGWNVLFSDYHAKRVGDASKKIDNAQGSAYQYNPPSNRIPSGNGAQVYLAWDYLSRNP